MSELAALQLAFASVERRPVLLSGRCLQAAVGMYWTRTPDLALPLLSPCSLQKLTEKGTGGADEG